MNSTATEDAGNTLAFIDLVDGSPPSADMADGDAALPSIVFSASVPGTYNICFDARDPDGPVRLRSLCADVTLH